MVIHCINWFLNHVQTPLLGLVLMYICFGVIMSIAYIFLLKRENARRDRGERDEIIENQVETHDPRNEKNGRYATVDEAKKDKGDEWSGYRYVIWGNLSQVYILLYDYYFHAKCQARINCFSAFRVSTENTPSKPHRAHNWMAELTNKPVLTWNLLRRTYINSKSIF